MFGAASATAFGFPLSVPAPSFSVAGRRHLYFLASLAVPSDTLAILEPGVCSPGRMYIHAARQAAPGAVGDFGGVGSLAQQPPSESPKGRGPRRYVLIFLVDCNGAGKKQDW